MILRMFVLCTLVFATGCTIKSRSETPTTAYDYSGYDVYGRPHDAYSEPLDASPGSDVAGRGDAQAPRAAGGSASRVNPPALAGH